MKPLIERTRLRTFATTFATFECDEQSHHTLFSVILLA
jgi:hypothetical protein